MNVQTQIFTKLEKAQNIVITAHISPDGDSVGSSLALYHVCKSLGLQVTICHPDPTPTYLSWLTDFNQIINFEKNEQEVIEKLSNADLVFCLDYNQANRVGEKMLPYLESSKTFKIMIDHHLFPADFPDILYSDTSACSTCQLIFEVIERSGNISILNKDIATALYLGIMTDTGSFRFNSVKPRTHEILAILLETGIEHDVIHEQVFDINTVEKLKLRAFATSEKLVVLPEFQTAYISLLKEELDRFNYHKGDTEGLVNVALSIEGINIAAFFSEDDDKIKISFRSRGKENPINELASKYFHGGGHANASGGKFVGKMIDAIELFEKVLPEFHKK